MTGAPDGVARFPYDPSIAAWAGAARGIAEAALAATGAGWRHGGTWFAGVNVLPNGPDGGLPGHPLAGAVIDALAARGDAPARWDRAQISAVAPGYPGRDPGESDAQHRFRRDRAGAHVDGLLPVGPARRRMLKEAHGFILGLPLTEVTECCSPMIAWCGSHRIIGTALGAALSDHPVDMWPEIDLTEAYHAARREALATCRPVPLLCRPGEAYLVHRHTLHGIAPWAGGPDATPRIIAYFRPEIPVTAWI
ncbi:MAG: hypothetical protein AAF771_01120 [Pseudomonadota bacterium]